MTRQSLLVPQHWHRLTNPGRSEDVDFAAVATVELARGGTVLVIGEPGIGKSLTISRVFESLTSEYVKHPNKAPLPVFVHLGDVTLVEDKPDGAAQASGILSTVTRLLGLPHAQVERWIREGHLITLLDGLDEAAGITGGSSVRAALASSAFASGRLVTSRRDFFDLYAAMPEMEGHFGLIVELERLPFDSAIGDFVSAYCAEFERGDAAAIMETIHGSLELQDLTSRPLTLWMTVDVLADPPTGTGHELGTLTSLYRRYTKKWLQREAVRPGALVERADDKRALVRVAARAMFQLGTALGGAARSTTELAVSRDQLAETLRSPDAGSLVSDVVSRLGLHAALDELCLRTFLVRGSTEEGYRFAHKSFFEYFVALDLWECVGRESRLEIAEGYFARPLSDPVVYFFREMLALSRVRADEQRLICQNMIALLTNRKAGTDARAETIRQHVGNLLAGVADARTSKFLADYLDREPSEFVRRGIVVGLGLQQGRTDLVLEYVKRLRAGMGRDDQAISIQLGYSRIYHGDQDWTGRWEDDGSPEVTRTVEAQIDRLLSSRNRSFSERLWPLTLFTLRALLEDGRGWRAVNSDLTRRERLVVFLAASQPGRGEIFEDERRRLLRLLTTNDQLTLQI